MTLESCSAKSSSFCWRGVLISSVATMASLILPMAVEAPVPMTTPLALPEVYLYYHLYFQGDLYFGLYSESTPPCIHIFICTCDNLPEDTLVPEKTMFFLSWLTALGSGTGSQCLITETDSPVRMDWSILNITWVIYVILNITTSGIC